MDHEESVPSYLNRLTQEPLLSAEEETGLTTSAQGGCARSRQRLIESNMRLVINIARSYRSRTFPLEDLVQEGAIGLMHAINRFDPSKGFRFSTYATHWIRQSIGRAIDYKSKAIRLPAHISQSLRRIDRERVRLTRELGTEPSHDQLAAAMGISPRKLQHIMLSGQEMLSLDSKVGDAESSTLGVMVPDTEMDAAEGMITQELTQELHVIMMELSERERRVMANRLRMDTDGDGMERDDLARELKISRERIRQIELQAMKKLRAVASDRLRELLNR
ncbi:MAG: sigma-70 family RNA polymerase sigma factor [Chthonomonas sp.]|nr:sigma-70 family RNA polymerase sigma factor [Chthonomonas sp.]